MSQFHPVSVGVLFGYMPACLHLVISVCFSPFRVEVECLFFKILNPSQLIQLTLSDFIASSLHEKTDKWYG